MDPITWGGEGFLTLVVGDEFASQNVLPVKKIVKTLMLSLESICLVMELWNSWLKRLGSADLSVWWTVADHDYVLSDGYGGDNEGCLGL